VTQLISGNVTGEHLWDVEPSSFVTKGTTTLSNFVFNYLSKLVTVLGSYTRFERCTAVSNTHITCTFCTSYWSSEVCSLEI